MGLISTNEQGASQGKKASQLGGPPTCEPALLQIQAGVQRYGYAFLVVLAVMVSFHPQQPHHEGNP